MSTLPQTFGRYVVESELGDGSMGRVYRAWDPLMKRTVAVKTVKTEYLSRDSAPDYLRRFSREAHAAGRLSHPNIVSLFDVGDDFFVMEYLDGLTLQQLLQRQGKLPLADALALLGPLADALDYAHSEGVIHRDIKPANIMVLPDGRPKLMDFGVARLETHAATATGTGQFFGSPSYMAPEQVSGVRIDRRADLFALAVLAYETITGHRPFEGQSITAVLYRVVHEPAPPPRQWDPELPPVYDQIFRRALHKDPARRYHDATALVAALKLKDPNEAFDDLLDEPAPGVGTPNPLATPVPAEAAPRGDAREWSTAETQAIVGGSPRVRRARVAIAVFALLAVIPGALWWAQRSGERRAFRVEAVPDGAQVWVDGQLAGPAPVNLPGLAPGPHRVRVTMDGYAPAELGLDLPPGSDAPPLRFSLQAIEPSPVPAPSVAPAAPATATGRRTTPAASAAPRSPWVRTGDLVALDGSVTPPRRVAGDTPRYPEPARRLRLLGSVRIEMLVDELGVVRDPRVVESAGDVLDTAVLDAVHDWRYEPARKDGVAVKVRWSYRHSFVAP